MKWQLVRSGQWPSTGHEHTLSASAILVMPCTDPTQASQAAQLMANRAGVNDALLLAVIDEERQGFIATANRVFARTQSTYFGYVAQDAYPGRQWLQKALHTLEQTQKSLLGFNDGKWHGMLASFGLGRRTWFSANYAGPLFHPGYQQHYADTELTVLALDQNQYCHNPHAVLIEIDWEKDHKRVNDQDKQLFAHRKTGWLKDNTQNRACLEIFK